MKIKHKLFLILLFSFSIGFLILNFFLKLAFNNYIEDIIKDDFQGIRKNIENYVNQYFYVNNITFNENQFINHSQSLGDYITKSTLYDFNLIDINQEIIYQSTNFDTYNLTKDIFHISSNSAIKVLSNDTYIYYFNLTSKETIVGKVFVLEDYSSLYDHAQKIVNNTFVIIISIFIFIFLLLVFLINTITKPIIQLSKISVNIANGKFIKTNTKESNDEIGELVKNFKFMEESIEAYINKINEDKNEIEKLSRHRKEFFDNITHELKTPLTIIKGYGEMLKEIGTEDIEFFQKGINNIINESERLYRLVLEILEISRLNSSGGIGNYEEINFTELTHSVCEEMSFKAQKYCTEIKTNIKDSVYVEGDKDKLKEVLINLIDNSIKYGNPGNIITVKLFAENNIAYLVIKDKGIGISKEALIQVLTPYYKEDNKNYKVEGSYGLGLSIVSKIIKMHHGEIHINSELSKGTTVEIKLQVLR